ncbi:MAG TPA: hypothetical protein VGH53_29200 [Streptosporangiaceae bacterium]|jgi:hypothetical protein
MSDPPAGLAENKGTVGGGRARAAQIFGEFSQRLRRGLPLRLSCGDLFLDVRDTLPELIKLRNDYNAGGRGVLIGQALDVVTDRACSGPP